MTWNIHQRNLTPHYYDAPEQQLNEDTQVQVEQSIDNMSVGYDPNRKAKPVSSRQAKKLFSTKPTLRDKVKNVAKKVGSATRKVGSAIRSRATSAAGSLQNTTSV